MKIRSIIYIYIYNRISCSTFRRSQMCVPKTAVIIVIIVMKGAGQATDGKHERETPGV